MGSRPSAHLDHLLPSFLTGSNLGLETRDLLRNPAIPFPKDIYHRLLVYISKVSFQPRLYHHHWKIYPYVSSSDLSLLSSER